LAAYSSFVLLLPGYFRGEYFTAYALIEKTVRAAHAFAGGVHVSNHKSTRGRRGRVAAIALVVSVVLGTSIRLAVFSGDCADDRIHVSRAV